MAGKLHLIGSPIGNKLDISDRLIESIKNATTICVEDIDRFEEFCHANSFNYTAELIDVLYSPNNDRELNSSEYIINKLISGEDVHIISDEGMPGVADPGSILFTKAVNNNIEIIVSPGPSTIIAAAALAGVFNRFSFEGFLPHDSNERTRYWKYLSTLNHPMIFLLQNPMNMPVSTPDKTYASNESSNVFVFLKEAIENLGDRECMYGVDITTSKQKIIRSTLDDLYLELSNNNYPGNVCIVIY